MTVWTGTLPTWTVKPVPAQDLQTMVDALSALTDAWTSYAVEWTSGGTPPVLNNGTLEGRYYQAGKHVGIDIRFIAGNTTTFGTGQYFFSLPVNARIATIPFPCYLLDSGTANKAATAFVSSGLDVVAMVQGTTDVAATAPHTWANGDSIHIVGVYEVA